jgi:NAD(P)H-dependent glutamate synthase small subunit
MYGIPPMKLEKNLVNRRVELLSREGVEFFSSVHVGVDVEVQRLNEENDALLLACGATRPRDLKAPGRHLSGIYFAMDFLRASTKSYLDSGLQNGDFISARGKKVLVIGGGDTGTDCIATAIRHGCLEVRNFELLPQPPDERAGDNPWPQWPRVMRADYGHQEACGQFGSDPRSFGILTKQFIGDSEGNVTGVRTVRVRWIPGDMGMKMMELPGTEQVWEADMVLLALGFLGPDETLVPGLGLETDSRSNFKAGFGSYTTNVPGVFAAGDCRRGQSLVVWAIREGLESAEAIHAFVTKAGAE